MSSDSFSFKQFAIRQDRCAMKVGVDGTLLGAWAQCAVGNSPRILDIGTGTGLIALMMAQRFPTAMVTAIDIDGEAVGQAAENATASPFARQIKVWQCPVQEFVASEPFDAITCNPPFFEQSLQCPDQRRTTSRHTTTLSFIELMRAAQRLLTAEGELSLIIPCDALGRMEEAAAMVGLFARRQCAVKTTPTKLPKRMLLSYGKKPPQCPVDTEEVVVGSDEYKAITQDFYL